MLQNDVTILSIKSSQCKCALQDVDALYMAGVKVVLYNNGPATARNITVTLTYYLYTGERRPVTRTITELRPGLQYPFNMSQPGEPFLVKLSRGLVATIQADNDRRPGNNQMTQRECIY